MSTAPHPRERIAATLAAFFGSDAAKQAFDVVIVGSGYGGSVAAWVLSQCTDQLGQPLRVCLLERGNEFLPGDFPSTFGELPRELRVARQRTGQVEGTAGLFDLRLGDDVMALVANGVGGGSLINAGVMLEPKAGDHAGHAFATELDALRGEGWYRLARRLLGAEVKRGMQWIDNDASRWRRPHRKTQALGTLAQTDGQADAMRLPPITVCVDGQPSFSGTALNACNHCGDCMTGCNVGAKDSLDMGLLSAAMRGVSRPTVVTGATVTSLLRNEGRWELRVAHTDPQLQLREGFALRLKAERVILAAGALGSPEILLRSRDDGLVFSNRLGQGFSCNGDNIGAARGLREEANGCADEDQPLGLRGVGPTITGSVRLTPERSGGKAFELQEFSVPGALARLFDETVTTAATIQQMPDGDRTRHRADQADPLAVDAAAMRRTLLLGVIGRDDAAGTLVLANPMRPVGAVPQMGAVRIVWPLARDGLDLHAAHDRVGQFIQQPRGRPEEAKGASFIANPMWRLLPPELADLVSQPRGPVLTVHPLGGCGIGASAADGVVDKHGRVFDAAAGAHGHWHGTLVVLDGSIVPTSLGANPALTISALALRALGQLMSEWQLRGPDLKTLCDPHQESKASEADRVDGPADPAPPPAVRRTEVSLTERMSGTMSLSLGPSGTTRLAVVELTLAFEPTALRTLVGAARNPVKLMPAASHVRVWDAAVWKEEGLRYATDHERTRHLAWHAELSGTLRFLHREPSTRVGRTWRGAHAWLCNRGWRDLYQRFVAPRLSAQSRAEARARRAAEEALPKLTARTNKGGLAQFLALASRAGEVRRFDYELTLGKLNVIKRDLAPPDGLRTIRGHKRLTYNRRASPWRQLTELSLTTMPGLRDAGNSGGPAPVLKLDPRFLVTQTAPLLAIAHQRDQAESLAEMLSFGLYLVRVLASVHLWTFRKPDQRAPHVPRRLPGPIESLPPPQITELVVDRWPADSASPGAPLSIRLTRYARSASGKPALVMLHGYSVSGNTFTHPALKPSAAEWFWRQGRDVWVIDLRTSSGLASATYPWAMEQAGLIDIPAALLHVRLATGRRVDVLAHCIGCAMLSMAVLSDAASVRSGNLELGVDTWLTSEHFGTLTAFNGAVPNGVEHPTINRVVLSQKGPLLRYTDANVLRAHVMQYARRWLLQGDYQFTPSAEPAVAEELLDRLLASLPYPDADYDIENPLQPWATTPWTATRHRMDALYGRDFSADNLSDSVLRAIDDLFGPINLDTVSQTIHFARFSAITNQRGRGEFVTRKRMQQRWGGIPTFAIHGADNGLIDAATEDLLLEEFGAAGLALLAHTHPGMGHQDVLIGERATGVFKDIELFLNGGRRPEWKEAQPPRSPLPPLVVVSPWVGPRMLAPMTNTTTAFTAATAAARAKASTAMATPAGRIACISRPDQGKAALWLGPAWRREAPDGTVSFELASKQQADWIRGQAGPSGRWLTAEPGYDVGRRFRPLQPGDEPGWLAVFAYAGNEVTAMATRHPFPSVAVDQRAATEDWLRRESTEIIERCFVRQADLNRLDGVLWPMPAIPPTPPVPPIPPIPPIPPSAEQPLRFAVASCQYPHGLFDARPAGASLRALAGRRDGVSLALMLGDQIYADATAGLLDPTRSDELYLQPSERAMRTPAMSAVMRHMPTPMLLDDHEIEDNWEPLPASARGPAADRERLRLAEARGLGMGAYFRFQRPDLKGLKREDLPRHADLAFEAGGHAFLLLDTRSARQRGAPLEPLGAASLIDADQFARLQAWLVAHRERVKFIGTSSLLLPRRALSTRDPQNAIYSDAWCGYPGGLTKLLRFIAAEGIGKTVFLSGDEHHALHAVITLRGGAQTVRVLSVHSSALYAPFPFANGRQADLLKEDAVPLDAGGTLKAEVTTTFAPPGDGFAVLHVAGEPHAPLLHIEYAKADGSVPAQHALPL